MCGLAGFINKSGGLGLDGLEATARSMAGTLAHRGPDDKGTWVDPEVGLAFGFQRLSILDLTPAGHQPMVSGNGRWVLVYNGEVYNFADLRRELEDRGIRLRGKSDSEVVVESCAQWGVEAAARRFIGMFSFAVWDRLERTLYMVRDRLGVKPLYWGQFGNLFLFGSELKALRAHPGWKPEIDRDTLAAYFRHTYCPAPHTIYRNVYKLLPGHILSFRPENKRIKVSAFWSVAEAALDGLENPLVLSENEAADELDRLLRDAVSRRLVSDVPVGAFLSGGIDSSVVVAAMQACGSAPAKTFTIGFEDAAFDEAKYAKQVAEHLGTDHTEHYITPATAQSLITELPFLYDEPFADSSQIPTALISRLTREKVTVALSGDGGDELFGGYGRYFAGEDIWRRVTHVPVALRSVLAHGIKSLPPKAWTAALAMVPGRFRPNTGGEALHWYAGALKPGGREEIYRHMVSTWPDPEILVPGAKEHRGSFWRTTPARVKENFLDHMQYLDAGTYLPDDILVKVDRASMAFGLEVRGPLLDHRILEFAWKLPRPMKVRDGTGKWLLRKVLDRYVPRHITDRPKMGFGVPIGDWVRGSLRDWAEDLLSEKRLEDDGWIDTTSVRRCWEEHLKGADVLDSRLWSILMFQSWRDKWMK